MRAIRSPFPHRGAVVLAVLTSLHGVADEVVDPIRLEFELARLFAATGSAVGQFHLGQKYANGEGVAEDDVQAVSWYRKAAEQGHADSQFTLAGMYYRGEGVPKDDGQMATWLRRAAEQGHALAQLGLGDLYARGVGVLQDYVQAYVWFNLSATRGQDKAGLVQRDFDMQGELVHPGKASGKNGLGGMLDIRAEPV